jgi:predicted heme/steroid binding protein
MFRSVAARGERGGLAVVNANGYNTSTSYNTSTGYNNACGYNAGSDLSEQMCESVAPTVRQRMKSHLHTVWLTRFQKSCAYFVALRNISF